MLSCVVQAFSRKCIERRKEWLTSWLSQRRERRAEGLNESFLYGAQVDAISFSDFINKELILFSNADNERYVGEGLLSACGLTDVIIIVPQHYCLVWCPYY